MAAELGWDQARRQDEIAASMERLTVAI